LLTRPENSGLIHLAARRGDRPMVQFLLENGAAVDATDAGRRTALWYAADGAHAELVQDMIDHGAEVNHVAAGGPILFAAVNGGDTTALELVIEAGADLEATYDRNEQYTALCIAAMENQLASTKALVEAGANIDHRLKVSGRWTEDETPLTKAVEFSAYDTAKYLLEQGATWEGVGVEYKPLLHYAARYDYPRMVQLLLDHGVPINSVDRDGETALDWAMRSNNRATMKLLRKAGGVRGYELFDQAPIAKLVAQLDDPSFAERETADKALRALGKRVAEPLQPYLDQAESEEVRYRLQAIINDLKGQ
jgi:ankyrin repeat protein